MAEFLGIPYKTYQKVEQGNLPQKATMAAITKKLGESELSMVQVAGLKAPAAAPELADLMAELRALREESRELKALVRQPKRPELMQPFSEAITLLSNMEEHALRSALNQMAPIGKGRVPDTDPEDDPELTALVSILRDLAARDQKKLRPIAALILEAGRSLAKGAVALSRKRLTDQ